mmetsp:Transcript_3975/g.9786  ORF Transcript_3975/g.9786 Transcript_3975/m.9786 type:complete len:117 (-) Transcript_3975:35-385(-)
MFLWKHSDVIVTAGYVGWLKILLFVAFLAPALYIPRFFCRYVCPLGALMEPLMPYRLLRLECTNPKRMNTVLEEVCPMDVRVEDVKTGGRAVMGSGCVHCGRCVTAAPLLVTTSPY